MAFLKNCFEFSGFAKTASCLESSGENDSDALKICTLLVGPPSASPTGASVYQRDKQHEHVKLLQTVSIAVDLTWLSCRGSCGMTWSHGCGIERPWRHWFYKWFSVGGGSLFLLQMGQTYGKNEMFVLRNTDDRILCGKFLTIPLMYLW